MASLVSMGIVHVKEWLNIGHNNVHKGLGQPQVTYRQLIILQHKEHHPEEV